MDRQLDGFRYGPDELLWFEQFTLRPVPPDEIRTRDEAGETLAVLDIPSYLSRSLASSVDTGTALYRLVQLFGTPNVPGLEAGAHQPERSTMTWQYLLRAEYRPEEGDDDDGPPLPEEAAEFLLSVYDFKTNLSVGIAGWTSGEGREPGAAAAPSGTLPAGMELPDERFLVPAAQLVLSMVEEPVAATYKELWV